MVKVWINNFFTIFDGEKEICLPEKFYESFRAYRNISSLYIRLFLDGIESREEVSVINTFFKENFNCVLQNFLSEEDKYQEVQSDISSMLLKENITLPFNTSYSPNVAILLKLWKRYQEKESIPDNVIVLYFLKHPSLQPKETIEEISTKAIFLGEEYLKQLLEEYNIKNVNGSYDLKNCDINDRTLIESCLTIWLDKFPHRICKEIDGKAILTLSACYRYIQWAIAVSPEDKKQQKEKEAKVNLVELAKKCFSSLEPSDFKDNVINLLNHGFDFGDSDHLNKLFGRDSELVQSIKKYADSRSASITLENYDRIFQN